ncbi:MAG: glycosyltransferase family 4 protein [Planctomycetota bacterium]|jgi:glycosyltransferase involved in cell wall biosynthesis
MKILEVVHDYLPHHVGGTEIHAHQIACFLRERGHEVLVATTERDLEATEGTVRERELDGVPIREMVHQREFAHMRESWRHPIAPGVFDALLGEFQPDLVHFHHLAHWGAECVAIARKHGARVVVTLNDFHLLCVEATLLRPDGELCERGPEGGCTDCIAGLPLPGVADDDELRAFHLSELTRERLETHRWYLKDVPTVICPSRFLADRMIRAGVLREDQVVVKRYGYPGPTHPLRDAHSSGPLRVGYVGGIYPSKGVHVLVEAVASLDPGSVELDVHGILEWFPDYVERLRGASQGAAIRFQGGFEPEQIDTVMQSHDVLVVPSIWYENMPITIQEAFRNGVPVVATDLGGMAEAVRDGVDGLLFPRGDAQALASILARLAADRPELERLAAGRPAVPTVEQIGAEIEALYQE